MSHLKCFEMVYDSPSLSFFNLHQGQILLKLLQNTEQKINLIYSYYQALWQGPFMVFETIKKLDTNRIICLVDCQNNVGLTLSFLRIGIKKIVFKSNDIQLSKKINEIANEYGAFLFDKEKFKNKILLENFDCSQNFKSNTIFELKKYNIIK